MVLSLMSGATFNRTSLESKRWYRLWARRRSYPEYQREGRAHNDLTFNRTSLESKHYGHASAGKDLMSFNRTSLESKPGCRWTTSHTATVLLIEPVWNRNNDDTCNGDLRYRAFNRTSLESKRWYRLWARRRSYRLLIEPVWNRNIMGMLLLVKIWCLLIEPVWKTF
jgi:hypothetical protein